MSGTVVQFCHNTDMGIGLLILQKLLFLKLLDISTLAMNKPQIQEI